jgi:TonB-dependent receptor
MHRVKFAVAALAGVSLVALSRAAVAAAAADSGSTVSEVIVTAAPREEERARDVQLAAPGIVNVQSAETIAKYPDYNAAEALGRIPGVSLSTDTGEGRFVNIRGIDANLNGATYGGVVLLNTFAAGTAASASGRAVEFDTIPTGAIDGIVVYKTLSPDREAEGLGGQIELTPRSSKALTKPFLDLTVGWGYEPLHDHTGPFTGEIAAGARFGFNNGHLILAGTGQSEPVLTGFLQNATPFSLVVTGSRKDDRRGVDDTEPSYTSDGAIDRADFRYYDYHRRRFGYGMHFDFTPNDDHSWYVRADVAGYKERAHKNHFYAQFDGAPSALDANGFVTDGFQPQVDVVDLTETHRNTVVAAGGQDRFGPLEIDYRGAYSRATYVQNYYYEARFYGADTYTGSYNTADPLHFQYRLFQDAAETLPFISTDAAQYGNPPLFRGRGNPNLSSFYESDVDEEYSGVFNAKYAVHLFGYDGQFKAGVSLRLRDKVVNDFAGFSNATSQANLSAFSPSVGAASNYYMGYFPKAPYANIGAIDAYVFANTTLTPSIGRDFKDQENVYAGYLMYTTDIGKLGVLAGVRVEATDATYGNYLTTTTDAGDITTFVTNKNSYINAFPTVQLKYRFTPTFQARATYSTGIARPGFTQAGGAGGVDFTTSPRPQATVGNPNLRPTTGNNFDFDLEYYLPSGGIIQAGVFDKEFSNYIFRSGRINVTDPIFNGEPGDIFTFINENAYARGVELAYHQKFDFLPGLLKGLGTDANITWVDSRFKEYSALTSGQGVDEYSRLPGTSHVTWNAAAFYENRGLALRLAAEYVGASLFSLNGDRTIDTIQDRRLNLDFSSSYQFTRNVQGYFQVKNLLNTPLRYNDGIDRSRVQQLEYYGQTYEFGLKATF